MRPGKRERQSKKVARAKSQHIQNNLNGAIPKEEQVTRVNGHNLPNRYTAGTSRYSCYTGDTAPRYKGR